MGGKPIPKNCILNKCKVFGVRGVKRIWISPNGEFYYTWDSLHGEIEVFNKRCRHLGVIGAISGSYIKDAVKGRKIDV